MAPNPRHGKGTRVLWDEKDLSPFLTQTGVSASMGPGEVTTFDSSGDREYIKGSRDATISSDGLFAVASTSTAQADDIVNYLDDALGGSTKHVVTVDLERSTGGRAWLAQSDLTSYDTDTPVDDVITISVDAQASEGYRGGRILRPLVQSTTTESGSAVKTPDTTASTEGGTTHGGVGHLHVTAINTTGSGAVFKVQHSTSGSTWADLITFSTATAITFERSTVAGSVKEQLRSSLSAFPSTGTNTVTASVAFARHNART